MKITYCGTGSAAGIPALFCTCDTCKTALTNMDRNWRGRSQLLINDELLLDFPPDTFQNQKRIGFSLSKIKTLLITHSHSDHFYPQDILHYLDAQSSADFTVYGNEKVCQLLMNLLNEDRKCTFRLIEMKPYQTSNTAEGYSITALPATHSKKENCFMYIIEKNNKCLLYAHDTGVFKAEVWDYLSQLKVPFDGVSIDFNNGVHGEERGHLNFAEVVLHRDKLTALGLIQPNTPILLSHISHSSNYLHEELAAKVNPKDVYVAYDGLEMHL